MVGQLENLIGNFGNIKRNQLCEWVGWVVWVDIDFALLTTADHKVIPYFSPFQIDDSVQK